MRYFGIFCRTSFYATFCCGQDAVLNRVCKPAVIWARFIAAIPRGFRTRSKFDINLQDFSENVQRYRNEIADDLHVGFEVAKLLQKDVQSRVRKRALGAGAGGGGGVSRLKYERVFYLFLATPTIPLPGYFLGRFLEV